MLYPLFLLNISLARKLYAVVVKLILKVNLVYILAASDVELCKNGNEPEQHENMISISSIVLGAVNKK